MVATDPMIHGSESLIVASLLDELDLPFRSKLKEILLV